MSGMIGLPLRRLDPDETARCSRYRACHRQAVFELDGSHVQPPLDPPKVKLCAECLATFLTKSATIIDA